MSINVTTVQNKQELKQFIDWPHELYRDDPNYVPGLYLSEKLLLTRHPFHQHSEMHLLLARKNNKIVGRIAAILNNNHNRFNKASDGFFGFFDVISDPEVANALMEAAEAWLRSQKATTIIGPVSPSTNEVCGMLIDGFGEPPVVMTAYNSSYYPGLMDAMGFQKMTDLLAYRITDGAFDDKPVRLMDALARRLAANNITIRKVNLKRFDTEVKELMQIYNQAWDKNLGFVPMTDAEFMQMSKDVKLILDDEFCLIAEKDGQAIGFALCIPDINQVQIKLKKGRLFPFGFLKMLLGKKKISKMRVLALGVLEPYRKLGIEAVFYGTIIRNGLRKGFKEAEASWILENNVLMNRAMSHINGTPYKRYRIYEKKLEHHG